MLFSLAYALSAATVHRGVGFSPGRAETERERFDRDFRGDADAFLGDADAFLGDADAFLGDADAFLGDADAFLGDADAFLGDADAFLGDADAFLGDGFDGLAGLRAAGDCAGPRLVGSTDFVGVPRFGDFARNMPFVEGLPPRFGVDLRGVADVFERTSRFGVAELFAGIRSERREGEREVERLRGFVGCGEFVAALGATVCRRGAVGVAPTLLKSFARVLGVIGVDFFAEAFALAITQLTESRGGGVASLGRMLPSSS
ncbi:hypothetical protein TraAM80_08530 [Trypanosoma rangeli]|uniref:Uncharacterized protein n=1 Tax=Trypanosoma rangeli TaxID=5698 RepID=A0A422N063_TRYRA|nr:uncharacterized protein TraAM80_08530 [Trypanosoma rangeli]RNE98848.1 hypothetical protein TraAM80_08530 [Trypanosoma rangeli]|eukprot:RNE98848.1 hypothetical protein TraAM80_08530 [Trypanosoma rangeli]